MYEHKRVVGIRWSECRLCGVRDYAKAWVEPCSRTRPENIDLDDAVKQLHEDLDAFKEAWEHEIERPTMNEWAGEFVLWRSRNRG
jgi:hypothetical protein